MSGAVSNLIKGNKQERDSFRNRVCQQGPEFTSILCSVTRMAFSLTSPYPANPWRFRAIRIFIRCKRWLVLTGLVDSTDVFKDSKGTGSDPLGRYSGDPGTKSLALLKAKYSGGQCGAPRAFHVCGSRRVGPRSGPLCLGTVLS